MSLELWTTADIAQFLRLSPGWVRDSVVHEPSFPKPTRLPQAGSGTGGFGAMSRRGR
jgi:hypothetical protein